MEQMGVAAISVRDLGEKQEICDLPLLSFIYSREAARDADSRPFIAQIDGSPNYHDYGKWG